MVSRTTETLPLEINFTSKVRTKSFALSKTKDTPSEFSMEIPQRNHPSMIINSKTVQSTTTTSNVQKFIRSSYPL